MTIVFIETGVLRSDSLRLYYLTIHLKLNVKRLIRKKTTQIMSATISESQKIFASDVDSITELFILFELAAFLF